MNAPVRFEWNEDKAAANFAKHGLPFDEAIAVFLDPDWVAIETIRPEDGEDRMKAIGLIDGRSFTVVFIMRGTVCRIISARRSNSAEERKYGHGSIHA